MKTVEVFNGQVNDQKFTDKKSMAAYISYCIENNIDITNTMSQTTTKVVPDCECGCDCDCSNMQIEDVPSPYKTFGEYMVPFVNEDAFSCNERINAKILKDLSEKLKHRCEYFISNLSNKSVSARKYQHYIDKNIVDRLKSKVMWCSQRVDECTKSIKNGDDRIKRLQAEIDTIRNNQEKFKAIGKAYDEVGGYCSATIDSIENDARYNG